jgi:hypothetical protein
MRRLLLTLLLLPLLSRTAVDPWRPSPPPARLVSFPLTVEAPPPSSGVASVVVMPLDPDGERFKLTSADDGVAFDIDGDGVLDRVAWTSAGSSTALLALDVNSDGRVTSGKELFGSRMAPGAANGCSALIQMFKATGAPLSGSLHAGHALYEQLLLWVDGNHNGVSEPGELRRAREVYTAVGMGYSGVHWDDEQGNRVRYEGWMELRTDGPDQPPADSPGEQRPRLRRYFEVALRTR